MKRDFDFWYLQGPGWLLLVYLVIAQGISAFSYELGVTMGTQEPAEMISQVGTAFWYGFAFADLVLYIPLLACSLIAQYMNRRWWRIPMAATLGITVYWPIVCLVAVVDARDAAGWQLYDETAYWIVLPLITLWGIFGLWFMLRDETVDLLPD